MPGLKIAIQALTDYIEEDDAAQRKWGDYWFKRDLKHGFHANWYRTVTKTTSADASILLQGKFHTSTALVKALWICGNVERVSLRDTKLYFDVVYSLSDKYTEIMRQKGVECTTMLPATDHVYEPLTDNPKNEIIYMGNVKEDASWDRFNYIKALSQSKACRVNVIGDGWKRWKTRIPRVNRLYTYHPHRRYNELFSEYKLALYIHAEDMVPWNFVALRVLDMLATGNCLVLSNYNPGITEIFGNTIPMFKNSRELVALTKYFLKNENERKERWQAARKIIQEKLLFKDRAKQIGEHLHGVWRDKKNSIS